MCVTTIYNSVCLQKAIWLRCDLASNPVRYAPWACSLLSDILLLKNNTDAGSCLTLKPLHSWMSGYFHYHHPSRPPHPPPPDPPHPSRVSAVFVWGTLLVLKSDMFPVSWPVDEAVSACLQLAGVNHGSAARVSPVGHRSAPGLEGICTVWSLWLCCLSPISSQIFSAPSQTLFFFTLCRFYTPSFIFKLDPVITSLGFVVSVRECVCVCLKALQGTTHYG